MNAGELSPLLSAREDLAKYHSGLSIMENAIPIPQGGAEKRPGTKFIAEVKTSSLKTRILPFEFSTSQSYIIEAGNQYMRFFTRGAPVTTGNGTETLPSGNIVAHWLLNEITGVTVNDDDGGTHDGTLSDSADAAKDTSLVAVTGKVGTGAFDLDGQYTPIVPDATAFSFTNNSDDSAFSIAYWGYVTKQSDIQVLLSKWQNSSTAREWRLSLSDDRKLQLHLADTSSDMASLRIAHWLLNEDAATKTVLDEDATSHDGLTQTSNTDDLTETGQVGKALDLGKVGDDAVVITNDHDELSFISGGVDVEFSITSWIYVVSDSQPIRYIISKVDTNTGSKLREWDIFLRNDKKIYFELHDESADAYQAVRIDNGLSIGWHFVVATYDGRGGDNANIGMTLYIDNIAVDTTRLEFNTYVDMENTTTKVVIGAGYGNSGTLDNYFGEKIDNVTLFNVELTPAQISVLWNDGAGTESLSGSVPTPFAITNNAIGIGWHFFVATCSTHADRTVAADDIILYVDGFAVDSTATNDADYTAMQNGAEEVRIGSQRNSGDTANEKFWADKIDEVSVFSDVLTPTEISTLFDETPYEIETPYLTADLFNLKLEQSADVLYINHPDYETRKLSRLANTLWTVTAADYQTGPFRVQNSDVADFIAASATTGSVTLTATGHTPFVLGSTAGHEPSGFAVTNKSNTGALFRLVHPLDILEFTSSLEDVSATEDVGWMDCGTLYKGAGWTFTTHGTWKGQVAVQRNYTIGAAHGDSGWETVLPYTSGDEGGAGDATNVTTTGTEDDGDADYRVKFLVDVSGIILPIFTTDQLEVVGIVEITSVTSSTEAIGTVLQTLASTDATYKWSEGAWSNYRGWPQTSSFFEDRLMFGGNTAQPDTIWGSVSSQYDDMTAGADDSDAVIFTLSSRQVNVIEWMIGKDKLLIGTSGAEWTIAGGTDEPLTPSNVIAKQHSTYGSANLQANLANESVLFFQRGAEKMRELAYNWELDTYIAPDMTILANLVTNTGITDTAFQRTPNSILWTTRTDGELPIFSYERAENITAWSRMITQVNHTGTLTDSDFESVAVINGSPEDEVWVIVKRTMTGVNSGSPVRYIEQFQPRDFGDSEDAIFVDSCVTYSGASSSAMTGLDHLEGQTVYVLADGVQFDTEVVSGGAITLSLGGTTTTATPVQMGLGYEVQLRTMPLSWLGGQTIQGKQKKISEVISRWYKSGDFSIGRDADNLQTYSITNQTTDIDRKTFSPGWTRNGYIFVYQLSPEPLTLLSIMSEFNLR